MQPTTTPTSQPSNVNLDDVDSGLAAFLKRKWLIITILTAVAIVFFFVVPFLGILIIIVAPAVLQRQYENNLFKAFAVSNHFSYSKSGAPEYRDGLVFSLGHSQHFSDIVSGTYQQWPFSLCLFTYTIGYGKGSQTFNRAVMALNFQTQLPAFVLKRHSLLASLNDEGESMRMAGYAEKLDLEGDFDKYFRVYLVPNTQVEVLSILTPDVMQLLLGLDKYEIELTRNGTFYVYSHTYINKKQNLVEIYTILQSITAKIGAYAAREASLQQADKTK